MEAKEFVRKQFKDAIVKKSLSGGGKKLIERKAGCLLAERTWVQIKSCIKNMIDKEKHR